MFRPHDYQKYVIDRIVDDLLIHDKTGLGLFLDPGLGKTACVLRALEISKALGEEWRTLVVAPLRVALSVWPEEISKWRFHLQSVLVHGSPARRLSRLADGGDVFITTPDLMPWLAKLENHGGPWDLVVVDESTKFKTWGSKRSKALRKILPSIPRRLILTGTPSPDSLADLHAQIYVLDGGERLGRTQSYFRARYMYRGGFEGREWMIRPGVGDDIRGKISDIVIRLDAVDYLDLPEILINDIWVDLPGDVSPVYRRFARELAAELEGGAQLVASGAGGKYVMCRQLANGGCYEHNGDERVSHHIHDAKTEVLTDLVEELSGKPVIVFYQFHHDRERLQAVFPNAPALHGGMSGRDAADVIESWNADRIKVLLAQPQAMSHGLNLQYSSCEDICWYGLPDSLEIYQQANARIYRQGQAAKHLRIHRLLTRSTVDTVIRRRVDEKDTSQRALLAGLRDELKSPFAENDVVAKRPKKDLARES